MCGLLGFIDYNKSISKEQFDIAVDTMMLRGPDARGSKIHDAENFNVGLGHRRLNVVDLDPRSNQPFYDKELGLIYNGEIYNYEVIKDELIKLNYNFITTSDTEVILKAYREWGLDCVDKFIGMFAIAIYDHAKEKIYLIRDRLGVKPLYFYQDKHALIFSSDSKAINTLLDKKLDIDEASLNGFFSFGFIPGLQSIFKEVNKIRPGHILSLDLNSRKTESKKYWDIKDYFADKNFKDSNKRELKQLLEDAIKLRLVSDVEVGSYLSGGLDSSYTTKILSENSTYKTRTFTVGFNEDFDEAPHAKKVAKLIGTNHTTYYIKPEDISEILSNYSEYFTEPFADNTGIPMLYLSQKSKKQVKVVISSDGGDELFAGYYIYLNLLKYNKLLNRIPNALKSVVQQGLKIFYYCLPQKTNLKSKLWKLKNVINKNNNIQFTNLLFYGSRMPNPVLKEVVDKKILKQKIEHFFNFDNVSSTSNLKKMLYVDIHERLANQMLVKVDKSTMGGSIEGREPLLDHRLFEFMFSFSEDDFIKDGVTKYRFREIINEEFNNNEILNKPKKSFETPLLKWLKDNFSDYVEKEIKSIADFKIPYLNQNNLMKLWYDYENLRSNKKELIWRSLVYIQWYKTNKL